MKIDPSMLKMVLVMFAWLVFVALVLWATHKPLKRLRMYLYGPLIKKLGMKPVCPWCEAFIPEPRPAACPKCGHQLRK